jgi:hypothetical protein
MGISEDYLSSFCRRSLGLLNRLYGNPIPPKQLSVPSIDYKPIEERLGDFISRFEKERRRPRTKLIEFLRNFEPFSGFSEEEVEICQEIAACGTAVRENVSDGWYNPKSKRIRITRYSGRGLRLFMDELKVRSPWLWRLFEETVDWGSLNSSLVAWSRPSLFKMITKHITFDESIHHLRALARGYAGRESSDSIFLVVGRDGWRFYPCLEVARGRWEKLPSRSHLVGSYNIGEVFHPITYMLGRGSLRKRLGLDESLLKASFEIGSVGLSPDHLPAYFFGLYLEASEIRVRELRSWVKLDGTEIASTIFSPFSGEHFLRRALSLFKDLEEKVKRRVKKLARERPSFA